jgi:hypothetical protein
VAAILVGVLKCRTQFWKRTTQESFQQSFVEIGSVVSKYVRRFGPSTKMAPTAELSLTWNLWEIHIKIFSSETTGPIAIKLLWNDPKLCPVIPTSNQDGHQAKNGSSLQTISTKKFGQGFPL